jgi:type I restriction enzyme S subunit
MIIQNIKRKFIQQSIRIDGKYFLNEDAMNSRLLEDNSHLCRALESFAFVFNPPIFKRQFCQKTDNAVLYCQSSDVTNSFEGSNVFVNKAQVCKVGAIVKKNQVLVTGFGTIGNTRLVNDLSNGIAYANNVCRIEANSEEYYGFIYAFLTSKYGRSQLNKNASGSVVRYIEAPGIKKTLIPVFSNQKQIEIHQLIIKASDFQFEANNLLKNANQRLLKWSNLPELTNQDYEFFGNQSSLRKVSTFRKNIKDISSLTINAFNYSSKIENLIKNVKYNNKTQRLFELLDEDKIFSTGSFPRLETNSSKSIRLINQSDIFNNHIVGKKISRRKVKVDNLVEYGEIIIAGVGTLGESETFCKVIFANEELENQLVSGEFLRMKTDGKIPSGYLFSWLSTEYGFRFMRSTQTGTKLCRPIQKLLYELPVPILDKGQMEEIHLDVVRAHTYRYQALLLEKQAIQTVENEIESWQN